MACRFVCCYDQAVKLTTVRTRVACPTAFVRVLPDLRLALFWRPFGQNELARYSLRQSSTLGESLHLKVHVVHTICVPMNYSTYCTKYYCMMMTVKIVYCMYSTYITCCTVRSGTYVLLFSSTTVRAITLTLLVVYGTLY